jgi:hypothetical protein
MCFFVNGLKHLYKSIKEMFIYHLELGYQGLVSVGLRKDALIISKNSHMAVLMNRSYRKCFINWLLKSALFSISFPLIEN